MLEDHADPERPGAGRVVDSSLLAPPAQAPLIRTQYAVDDFYKCAFAGTVLAEQGMNLTRGDFKINVVVRNTAGKRLADSRELQKRRVVHA